MKSFAAALATSCAVFLLSCGQQVTTEVQEEPAVAQEAATPAPRIIVIDRNVILRLSSAGQAMTGSMGTLSEQADTEFQSQAEQLQQEAQALQQQLAILAPDARQQRQEEFFTKQQDLQDRIQRRQQRIQGGLAIAGQQLDQALQPILQDIMRERNANMVLDRSAVIFSAIDIDVTATAIERLDEALPTLTVRLADPPAAQ